MKHRYKITALLIAAFMVIVPSNAFAGKFGGGSFGGGSKSSGSGGSKSSGGGYKSSGSGSSKPYTSGSKPTVFKPSSGSKPLPKPVTKLVAKAPPAKVYTSTGTPKFQPVGRNYGTDYRTVTGGSYRYRGQSYYYSDPYGPSYFGAYDSPLMYLWIYSWLDDDRTNNPPPPENDSEVDKSMLSYMQVIQAMQELSAGKSS